MSEPAKLSATANALPNTQDMTRMIYRSLMTGHTGLACLSGVTMTTWPHSDFLVSTVLRGDVVIYLVDDCFLCFTVTYVLDPQSFRFRLCVFGRSRIFVALHFLVCCYLEIRLLLCLNYSGKCCLRCLVVASPSKLYLWICSLWSLIVFRWHSQSQA